MHRRWCTSDFKRRPILRKLKAFGYTKDNPAHVHIGISPDESHRLGQFAFIDKPRYEHKVYPLIDHHITRKQCEDIIKEYGWEVPIKSGCDFCPFAGHRKIQELSRSNPSKFQKLLQLEKSTKLSLIQNHPLQLNDSLDEYIEPPEMLCDARCFT